MSTGKEKGNRPGKASCFVHYLHAVLLCGLLFFPAFFAGTAEAVVNETAPGMPRGLIYWAGGDGGGLYSLHTGDEGQAYVSRLKQGKKEESEVDPAVVGRVAEISRRHKADAWHFFAPPGWDHKTPGAVELTLTYDTGRELWIRALRVSADMPPLPAGFPAFERDLLAVLDEALDGPPQAGSTQGAPPRQGLKQMIFSQSGMSYESCVTYRINTRREAGQDVFRLMRRVADRISECALSDGDLADLEALLDRHRVAAWNGFKGNARNVLDGNSFSLSLAYTDGRKVSANGYMRFPKGYGEAEKAIRALLDGILEKSGAPVRKMQR